MTNAEKFEKVFGKKPSTYHNPFTCSIGLPQDCRLCKYHEETRDNYSRTIRCKVTDWWNDEYVDPLYEITATVVGQTEKGLAVQLDTKRGE